MRNKLKLISFSMAVIFFAMGCNNDTQKADQSASSESTNSVAQGQSGVKDEVSAKNVVQIAISNNDFTTLVTAIKAAELVDALSNAGPFTVFAPTNEAFNKLPAGTVEGLLKPEKKDDLTDILQYHVSLGVFKPESFTDGQILGQVNGSNINIKKTADGIFVNGTAKIIASVPAANGIIHVIDGVVLPPPTK